MTRNLFQCWNPKKLPGRVEVCTPRTICRIIRRSSCRIGWRIGGRRRDDSIVYHYYFSSFALSCFLILFYHIPWLKPDHYSPLLSTFFVTPQIFWLMSTSQAGSALLNIYLFKMNWLQKLISFQYLVIPNSRYIQDTFIRN